MNSLTTQLWLTLFGLFVADVTGLCNNCNTTCDIKFEAKGCFKDTRSPENRALPHYIYQERDRTLQENFGGRTIEWNNWNEYYPGFACRCAQRAKELGYDLFGLQFYGECWAGNSSQDDYAKHGSAEKGCIEQNYQACQSDCCMGGHDRNMVYQILDTGCSEVTFEKVGCYKDRHISSARPLPDYLFNDRDPSIDNFSGQRIDWENWGVYLPALACRCAKKAKELKHTFFGIQFYGECWSGGDSDVQYYRDGISESGCVDQCYQPCTEDSNFCSGKHNANYVYRIIYEDAPSDVHITPVGCYKEDAANPAMQVTFYNEFGPEMPNFAKRLLPQSSKDYKDKFPAFLLKCARKAKENKWEYFAVREHGLCVRSSNTITDYKKYGSSDQCFEGDNGEMCTTDPESLSLLCGGKKTEANYVYKITLPDDVEH